MMKSFWPNVRKILNPMDMLIFLTLYLTHVRFLKFLHVITMSLRRKVHKIAVTTEYKESIFGFLERPVTMTIMFLPFVYGLDISNIVMHCLGFDFHIKGDLSRLCCVVYEAVTAGVFITKLKDFLLNLHRLKTFQRHQLAISRGDKVPFHRRDHIREGTYCTTPTFPLSSSLSLLLTLSSPFSSTIFTVLSHSGRAKQYCCVDLFIRIMSGSYELGIRIRTRYDTHTHANIHANTFTIAHTFTYAHMHVRTHTCTHALLSTTICKYTSLHTHTYTHMHIHVHIHTYIQMH